ncbi:hypothetical protein JOC24_004459 [Streptomyces sp. HB132]|nr:hypothetical protein [Streptomyces sp. HB132]
MNCGDCSVETATAPITNASDGMTTGRRSFATRLDNPHRTFPNIGSVALPNDHQ